MFTFQLQLVPLMIIFLAVPLKTVTNVVSAVPASAYIAGFYDGNMPILEFIPVDIEAVLYFISALSEGLWSCWTLCPGN